MHCAPRRHALACLTAATLAPAFARAADWPTRPITLVVPQGTGSGSDVTARLVARFLADELGQPVVVENRTGGSGIIAHQSVMNAPADGYTVLFTSTASLLVVPAINPSAKFGLDDFEPVASVLRAPFALLVANQPAAPATVQDLVERLRSGRHAYASAGIGTMTHLGSEIFLQRAGVAATHVPYRGSGAALTDLLGGQVLFATDSLTAAMPQIRAGKLRALAVTTTQRQPSLPEVPTLAEAGLPGEAVAVIGGVFAPKGVPRDVAGRWASAAAAALRNPELAARFARSETEVLQLSNSAFLAQLRKEQVMWTDLVRRLGIKYE